MTELRDVLAGWIVRHCHKTCGAVMNVERETALADADEILTVIREYLDGVFRRDWKPTSPDLRKDGMK